MKFRASVSRDLATAHIWSLHILPCLGRVGRPVRPREWSSSKDFQRHSIVVGKKDDHRLALSMRT